MKNADELAEVDDPLAIGKRILAEQSIVGGVYWCVYRRGDLDRRDDCHP